MEKKQFGELMKAIVTNGWLGVFKACQGPKNRLNMLGRLLPGFEEESVERIALALQKEYGINFSLEVAGPKKVSAKAK